MPPKVFFTSAKETKHKSLREKLAHLCEAAGLKKIINPKDLVAIKLNVGEAGNTAFVRPIYLREIADKVKKFGGKPFLTDANTLYKGKRMEAVSHTALAIEHGFGYPQIGAPFIVADGLTGKEYQKVAVNLNHFKETYIGAAAYHADVLISFAHFKGHSQTGFGGAIKNIGMGLGSRSGKQQMHADVRPQVNKEKCTGCEKCIRWCPTEAIRMENHKAIIDLKKCIGCGECVVTCPSGAIAINWEGSSTSIQEKMAEYTQGVIQNKKSKLLCINTLLDISPDCDCWPFAEPPIAPDIGFLASEDPVAIDQASIDLVNKQAGKDIFKEIHPGTDWNVQLKYGEEIKLGKRKYELVTV